jgi:hypothetical protein
MDFFASADELRLIVSGPALKAHQHICAFMPSRIHDFFGVVFCRVPICDKNGICFDI